MMPYQATGQDNRTHSGRSLRRIRGCRCSGPSRSRIGRCRCSSRSRTSLERKMIVGLNVSWLKSESLILTVDPLFPQKIISRKVPCTYWSKTFMEIVHAFSHPKHFQKKLAPFFTIWRCVLFATPTSIIFCMK